MMRLWGKDNTANIVAIPLARLMRKSHVKMQLV